MSRCVITCSSPGCNNLIVYDRDDDYVHLYCTTHRSRSGRHAAIRYLKKAEPINAQRDAVDAPDAIVVLRCPRCKLRREVSEKVWKKDAPIVCECGKSMLYHRSLGDEHVGGGKQ